MNYSFFRLFFLFTAFAFAGSALAHSTGSSLEKIEGEYKIDIGVSQEAIGVGDSTRFSFELYSSQTQEPVDYSDVWVFIRDSQKTLFSSDLHSRAGLLTTMNYVFTAPGSYTLEARYMLDGKKLAETSFP